MSALGVALVLGQLADLATESHRATLSLSDHSEARLRSRTNGGNAAADVETLPTATFLLDGRRTDFFLGYGARIAELDLFRDRTFAVAHSASVGFGWAWTPRLHLDLVGAGSIGKQLTNVLGGTQNLGTPVAAAPTTFAPPVDVINVLSYRADLGVGYRLSRSWDLLARGGYGGGRGLDAPSETIVPEYYGPSGQVSVGYAASRHDRLATGALSSYTFTPKSGAEYVSSSVTESWTHAHSKWTTTTAGIGVSWLLARPARHTPQNSTFAPSGEVALAHAMPLAREETLSVRVGAHTGISFDPVLGAADPQVGATASATWTVHKFGTTGTVDAITTIPTEPGRTSARQLAFSVVEFYNPVRVLRLETGLRGFVQDLPPGAAVTGVVEPNVVQWVVFVGVTILLPPLGL